MAQNEGMDDWLGADGRCTGAEVCARHGWVSGQRPDGHGGWQGEDPQAVHIGAAKGGIKRARSDGDDTVRCTEAWGAGEAHRRADRTSEHTQTPSCCSFEWYMALAKCYDRGGGGGCRLHPVSLHLTGVSTKHRCYFTMIAQ